MDGEPSRPPQEREHRAAHGSNTLELLAGLTLPALMPTSPAATTNPPCINLAFLDAAQPHSFYLTAPGMEALADCFAIVEGARLLLHSQLLSVQCSVVRELFLAQKESGGNLSQVGDGSKFAGMPSPNESLCCLLQEPDLSVAFQGASLRATVCFLRLMYSPDDAHPTNLALLADSGVLATVAGLAHKLDAAQLLDKVAAYLGGECARPCCCSMAVSCRTTLSLLHGLLLMATSSSHAGTLIFAGMPELVSTVHLVQHCQLNHLEERFLDFMASKLAVAAVMNIVLVDEQALAGLLGPAAARLLLKSHYGAAYPLPILDVRCCSTSKSGGFTFAIDRYSQLGEVTVLSPPVEIGGQAWRLIVCPRGGGNGKGTHLSGELL